MRKSVVMVSLFLGAMLAGAAWAGPTAPTVFYGCDFNGDGNADIAAAGAANVRITLLNGGTPIGANGFISNGAGAQTMAACGDIDGDGKADIVFNMNGLVKLQIMNGTSPGAVGFLSNGGNTYTAMALADLDGDGKADLISQGNNGQIKVQLLNGTTGGAVGFISDGSGTYKFLFAADFNGDGKMDLAGSSAGAANVKVTLMNGVTPSGSPGFVGTGAGTYTEGRNGSGDVNGDGKADLIMDSPSNQTKVVTMDGTAILGSPGFASNGGGAYPFKLATDLDGDGKADLVGNGSTLVRLQLMNGTAVSGSPGFFGNGSGSYPALASGISSGNGKGNLFADGGAATGSFRISLVSGTAAPTNAFLGNGAGAFALPTFSQVPNP